MLLALWDQLQQSRVLLGRLDDVLDQEPEQGADHSAPEAGHDPRGPHRAARTRVPLRRVRTRRHPRGLNVVDRTGRDDRDRRPQRLRQVDARQAARGAAGADRGHDPAFDGHELRTLDYRTLRRQIGFVLQENYLFNDSIAENIAFGVDEPDMGAVLWAARPRIADEFVQRLPLGYETRVGESGLRLSGGQQQRLAIARALYHATADPALRRGDERARHGVRASGQESRSTSCSRIGRRS